MSRKNLRSKLNNVRQIFVNFDKTTFDNVSFKLLDELEVIRQKLKNHLIRMEVVLIASFILFYELINNYEYILSNCITEIKVAALTGFILCCIYFIYKKSKIGVKSIPFYMYCLTVLVFCLLLFPVFIMTFIYELKLCSFFMMIIIGWIIFLPIELISTFRATMQNTKTEIFRKFRNLNYNPENALFSDNELIKTEIFANFDTDPVETPSQNINPIKIDDTFDGHYKNVDFRIEEVDLLKTIKVGFWINDRSFYFYPIYCGISIFKGVIISFKFNKKINGKTIFRTNLDMFTRNNVIAPYVKIILGYLSIIILSLCGLAYGSFPIKFIASIILTIITYSLIGFIIFFIPSVVRDFKRYKKQDNADMKKVTLEGVEWEKRYKAFSTNQTDARYLLTPLFMQKFLNLTTAFGTKKAKCTLYQDKITIAISTNKNLFEFGTLFTPIDGDKFYEELASILDMIEYFKLNEHTGL